MAVDPSPTPPDVPPPFEEEPRRTLWAWLGAFVISAIVCISAAIAFGYLVLFLVPVAVFGYLAYRVLKGLPVRNPMHQPTAGLSMRYADGQPQGRSLRNEAAFSRLRAQARVFEDLSRTEHAESEERARAEDEGPLHPNGPPPNVPFP